MLQKTPRLGPQPSHADQQLRTLRLKFDDFGWESAATLAAGRGISLEEWIARCCIAYASRHGTGAVSLQPPRFKSSGGATRKLRIALPRGTWATLDRASTGFDLERLVEHAALSHAAREQEWIEAPPPKIKLGAPAVDGRDWERRRRLVGVCAVVVGILMVPVTLATAGVSLPGPVGSAFERVGIELPNQAQGPPPPVVLKDPRRSSQRSATGRTSEGTTYAGGEQSGGKRNPAGPAGGEGTKATEISQAGQTITEVPPPAIITVAPEVVPDVPAAPEVPDVPPPPPPDEPEAGGGRIDPPAEPLGNP